MSYIDQNTKNVGLGLIHGTDTVIPFTINPSTLELRVEIIPINSGGTIIAPQNINIDENSRNIGAGITEDSNESITPLTVNEIADFPCLRIDVL